MLTLTPENVNGVTEDLIVAEHGTRQTAKTATRHEIYKQVMDANHNDPPILQLAKSLASFLEQKDVIVLESDILAGHSQHYDYNPSIPVNMPGEFDPSILPSTKFNIDQEVTTYISDHAHDPEIERKAYILGQYATGIRVKLFKRFGSGHVIAAYDQVIEKGYCSLIEVARTRISTVEKEEAVFAKASLIVCEAAANYIVRYAVEARKVAEKIGSSQVKHQLDRIAEACDWVVLRLAEGLHGNLPFLHGG